MFFVQKQAVAVIVYSKCKISQALICDKSLKMYAHKSVVYSSYFMHDLRLYTPLGGVNGLAHSNVNLFAHLNGVIFTS